VAGGWRIPYNEKLHNLYALPTIIQVIISRKMRWAGHAAHMGKMENAYSISVGRPERKRPLRRPRHRWEDNVRMDLREIGWEGADCIHVAQDRDCYWGSCEHGNEPSGSIKGEDLLD
jgi:hypothetical protein